MIKKNILMLALAAAFLLFPACSHSSQIDGNDPISSASNLQVETDEDGTKKAVSATGTCIEAKENDDGSVLLTISNSEGITFELTRSKDGSAVADVSSWASGFDASGVRPDETRRDSDGSEKPFFQILKDNGVNTVRLRVWVEPYKRNIEVNSDLGWSGGSDAATLVAQAVAAQNAGLAVMVDFHYSDCWADPGKQVIPASWQKTCSNSDQLAAKVREHTLEVLSLLKFAGVRPAFVQVGNEINHGMLAHACLSNGKGVDAGDALSGRRQNQDYAVMAKYVAAGCKAVRSFDKSIKIILHVARSSYNNATIDALMKKGVTDFDIVGYSWYPGYGHGTLSSLANDVKAYVGKGKKVMCVETSVPSARGDMSMGRAYENFKDNPSGKMYADLQVTGNALAYSVDNQKNGLVHTMEEVSRAGGSGVFTWGGEMGKGNWGMFDQGQALASMSAFCWRP